MTDKINAVPEGFHTVTPHLIVRDAERAIAFYEKVFGAKLLAPISKGQDGKVIHASFKIGDSVVMLSDEFPNFGSHSPLALKGSPVVIHVYVENVDALFARAVDAGSKITMPLGNQFWGDRYGQVEDPFGHRWSLGQHIENVTHEESERRGKAMFAEMAKKAGGA